MAYREFLNETPYESPVIGDLPRTLQALQFTQQQKLLKQQQRLSHFDKYEQLVATGKDPYYGEITNKLAGDVTKSVHHDFYSGAQAITPETKRKEFDVRGLNKIMADNEDEVKNIHQQIMDTAAQDKYFIPTLALKRNANLISNEGMPTTTEQAKDIVKKHQNNIVNQRNSIYSPEDVLENFDAPQLAADFVKARADKVVASKYEGQSGTKSGTERSGVFFLTNGMPGISDETRQDFFQAHPMQQEYYRRLAMNDIQGDIEKTLADHVSTLKLQQSVLSHAPVGSKEWKDDAFNAIVQNPYIDPIDQRPVNERVRNKVDATLKSYEKTTSKIDVSLKDTSPAREAGFINPDVSSNEVFNGSSEASANISGVGRTISRTKPATSPYYKLTSRAPIRYDTDTGKVSTDNMPRDFILNSVEVVPVTASGVPSMFKATNVDELEKEINNTPLSRFGPNGITGVKMALRGQSVDKSVIDEAFKKQDDLEAQLASNPEDPVIKQKLSFLKEQLDKYNYGESVNYKFLEDLTGRKALHNELMPVNPGDANSAFIKDQTGADVYSQKFQSPAMLRIKSAIDRRVAEANATPVKEVPKAKKSASKITPTPDEFNSVWKTLKSGEKTVGPDGVEYTKK